MEAETIKQQLGNGLPGTYILCLKLTSTTTLTIGKLGQFKFPKGFYYYIGSAFGPGGIAARCKHHINISVKPRWHMDYLRAHCQLESILFSTRNRHLECQWADELTQFDSTEIVANKFGASDCQCTTHLFYSTHRLDMKKLRIPHQWFSTKQ